MAVFLGNAFTEMNQLQHEMNRLFDRFGVGERERKGGHRVAPSYPALDLWQDSENLYVEAELPGLELEELEIYVTGEDQLTLKGKREAPTVENGTWHRREREFGSFARALTLPHAVDADRVEAAFKHGIVTIALPKQEDAKPRRISVRVS